jgi:hypothetical protein
MGFWGALSGMRRIRFMGHSNIVADPLPLPLIAQKYAGPGMR